MSFWERFGDDFRRRFMMPFFDGLGAVFGHFGVVFLAENGFLRSKSDL